MEPYAVLLMKLHKSVDNCVSQAKQFFLFFGLNDTLFNFTSFEQVKNVNIFTNEWKSVEFFK